MAITDDWGKTWTASAPLVGAGNIQPSVVRRRDGSLHTLMRDNGPPPQRLLQSDSRDGGMTWSAVTDSELLNPGAGSEIIGLRNGRWVLINNDTEADPRWLEEILAAFERHPEAGLVASKMKLFDRRDTFHTAGDFYRLDGMPGNRGVWEIDRGQYDREEVVFSACGGSAAYRKTMLDQIGLLDEDFFYSCEDVDLAWRAQLAGWKCIYAPRAVVYHKLSATGGGATASFYDGRNFLYVLAKDYPSSLWKKYRGAIIRQQWGLFAEALRAWRGAAARARMRGMWSGIIHLPRMLNKRRTVQAMRKVDDAYLLSILRKPPEPVER
jgi:GT2 family glycosyltransferase